MDGQGGSPPGRDSNLSLKWTNGRTSRSQSGSPADRSGARGSGGSIGSPAILHRSGSQPRAGPAARSEHARMSGASNPGSRSASNPSSRSASNPSSVYGSDGDGQAKAQSRRGRGRNMYGMPANGQALEFGHRWAGRSQSPQPDRPRTNMQQYLEAGAPQSVAAIGQIMTPQSAVSRQGGRGSRESTENNVPFPGANSLSSFGGSAASSDVQVGAVVRLQNREIGTVVFADPGQNQFVVEVVNEQGKHDVECGAGDIVQTDDGSALLTELHALRTELHEQRQHQQQQHRKPPVGGRGRGFSGEASGSMSDSSDEVHAGHDHRYNRTGTMDPNIMINPASPQSDPGYLTDPPQSDVPRSDFSTPTIRTAHSVATVRMKATDVEGFDEVDDVKKLRVNALLSLINSSTDDELIELMHVGASRLRFWPLELGTLKPLVATLRTFYEQKVSGVEEREEAAEAAEAAEREEMEKPARRQTGSEPRSSRMRSSTIRNSRSNSRSERSESVGGRDSKNGPRQSRRGNFVVSHSLAGARPSGINHLAAATGRPSGVENPKHSLPPMPPGADSSRKVTSAVHAMAEASERRRTGAGGAASSPLHGAHNNSFKQNSLKHVSSTG